MTFNALETSRQKGSPSNLLLFKYGTQEGAYYAYTLGDRRITHNSIVYEPSPIDLPETSANGTLDRAVVEIGIPLNSGLGQLLRNQSQSSVVSLIVRQGHIGDPDNEWPVVFVARVLGGSIETPMMRLYCEPVSTSLRRQMLKRHFMRQCPFELYGPLCKANKAAATASYVPETVQDFGVTMPIGWVLPAIALRYLGGIAKWSGVGGDQVRTIVRVTSDRVLTFSGRTKDLTGGELIELSYGCSHVLALAGSVLSGDCKDVHNNILNYGGQFLMPLENPISVTKNIFY